VISTAQYKPSKQQNSNCKPFPFHSGFRISTQFNSRNHFCAFKQSVKEIELGCKMFVVSLLYQNVTEPIGETYRFIGITSAVIFGEVTSMVS
jgi:hypothetical protein